MSSVAIYMEGGGEGRDTKIALRQGMDMFLNPIKEAVRNKSWRWKLVPCGSRNAAFKSFKNAILKDTARIIILLVDAEGPVKTSAREHLKSRDGWDLDFTTDDNVHLMIQTMETWIIADISALTDYYGNNFRQSALPLTSELELISKSEISRALKRATIATQKKEYHKIRHASDLLKLIDSSKVWRRCPSCERLFNTLLQAITDFPSFK